MDLGISKQACYRSKMGARVHVLMTNLPCRNIDQQ
ncbi:hypothetical protein V6Z12_A10G045300 [Gossypium hirsutum]